MVTTLRQPR
ncbi:Uncharacterized protein HZ326_31318, partial [Fusarium oxysporum f. sp. albedinis]